MRDKMKKLKPIYIPVKDLSWSVFRKRQNGIKPLTIIAKTCFLCVS